MAYADQSMSGNRVTALIIVALIHILLGYALVTGLAYEAAKKVIKRVTTVDIAEEVKEEEPPPPPPKQENLPPPPPVAPPVKIDVAVKPPSITTVTTPPPAPPPAIVLAPPAPVPPPPPPPPAKPAEPRNNPGTWATPNDYPSRALREDREGTTTFRVTIDPEGKVASCAVTGSSGHADLDEATCKFVTRRARFRKPSEGYGTTYSNRVRWVIPE
ncbi:MAG: energy transducer TonB [Novosphingobium sp.]|nr:energy transducer TonB [Novosphingobium sp.]